MELQKDVIGARRGCERWSPGHDRRVEDQLAILVCPYPLVREADYDLLALWRRRRATASAAGLDNQPTINIQRTTAKAGNTIPAGDASPNDLTGDRSIHADDGVVSIDSHASVACTRSRAHIRPGGCFTCPGRIGMSGFCRERVKGDGKGQQQGE